eukprot:TRINITY_DN3288_c0_g2_i4.p1 TRINITY_DN3288_c0_g2~~TRINITY_DN3288_c0_g2_i4.p1  ORF type:complete len:282 (+),score=24.63 TRINITY_DN3288_c0_g2_i4:255-1100(+)
MHQCVVGNSQQHASFNDFYQNYTPLKESIVFEEWCSTLYKSNAAFYSVDEIIHKAHTESQSKPFGVLMTGLGMTLSMVCYPPDFVLFDSHSKNGKGAYYVRLSSIDAMINYIHNKSPFHISPELRSTFHDPSREGVAIDVVVITEKLKLKIPWTFDLNTEDKNFTKHCDSVFQSNMGVLNDRSEQFLEESKILLNNSTRTLTSLNELVSSMTKIKKKTERLNKSLKEKLRRSQNIDRDGQSNIEEDIKQFVQLQEKLHRTFDVFTKKLSNHYESNLKTYSS